MTAPSTTSIVRLDLGFVHLPDWHPRHADRTCPMYGFAVAHPDGVIVFDTGCGDHSFIEELYQPVVNDIVDQLNAAGLDERDVVSIVNSHLHFDHCGQNDRLLSASFHVQAAEREVAATWAYTVPEWADLDSPRLRLAGPEERLADGVTIIATPGHTPGHQSLAVETATGLEVIAGQPCYSCDEYATGVVDPADVHDPDEIEMAHASLEAIRSLEPVVVHLAHDARSCRRDSC